jgi:UDP-N-acetylmuramyl pentapeptide phosphotransferase/UDP-N-acetylglucosamine-1-phosphate transferase
MTELWLLSAFLVALVGAFLLTGVAGRVGAHLGLLDHPRRGELQVDVVPRTGGYGICAAFVLAVLCSLLAPVPDLARSPADAQRLVGVLLGLVVLLPVALADDWRRLGPLPQLVGQFAIAAVPVSFGLWIDSIALPYFEVVELPWWIGVPLTLFWLVAMINTINLVDVMDGLAGGIGAIAALTLFLRSYWFGQYTIAVLPLVLAGCCLGFLPRNWHRARLFMGTSGSMFLGYALGALAIIGGVKLGTTLIVLGLPMLDVAWVIMRRLARGRSPLRGGDQEHLPQRLVKLGLTQPRVVVLLYSFCGLFAGLGLALHSPVSTGAKLALLLGMTLAVFALLGTVTWLSRDRVANDQARV